PPGALTRLAFGEEATAIHDLVAAVLREQDLAKPTIQAAQAADKAARAVEQALVAVEKLQKAASNARTLRESCGPDWDAAFVSLRHDARAAIKDGAPQLYAALFPPSRPGTKAKADPEKAEPAPNTPPAPTVPATETSNAA